MDVDYSPLLPVEPGVDLVSYMFGSWTASADIPLTHPSGRPYVQFDPVFTLHRIPAGALPDRLAVVEWVVERKSWRTKEPVHAIKKRAAYVVEERKVTRYVACQRFMDREIRWFDRWERRKQYQDMTQYSFVGPASVYPFDPDILVGTTAENSKLDLFAARSGWIVSYLALWRKRPQAENLVVQGCCDLLAELIRSEERRGGWDGDGYVGVPKVPYINWKERRPARMLGLNGQEFRMLRDRKWDLNQLKAYQLVRDAGIPPRDETDLRALERMTASAVNRALREQSKDAFWRIARYLLRQKQDYSYLHDYWNMARRVGWGLDVFRVRWPKDLRDAHDKAAREITFQRNKEREPLFRKRAEELAWLSFAADGLLIRPCRDAEELFQEGRALDHCVASYDESHATGKTAILFIRRAEEPETPYYTLELDERHMTVRQNRGHGNCDRTEAVAAFEEKWLRWACDQKRRRVKSA